MGEIADHAVSFSYASMHWTEVFIGLKLLVNGFNLVLCRKCIGIAQLLVYDCVLHDNLVIVA